LPFEPCWRIKAGSKLGCALLARATPTTNAVAAPNFFRILEAMETYDSLPRVPDQWMEIVKAQVVELWPVIEVSRIRGGGGGAGGGDMLPAPSRTRGSTPIPTMAS